VASDPRVAPNRLWLRVVCTALGTIILAPVALVVVGGFLPKLPVLGRFGYLIVPALPWLCVWAAAAVALTVGARRLGGGPIQAVLAGASILTLVGAIVMVVQVVALAAGLSAPLSLGRALALSEGEVGDPDQIVVFATVDGQPLRAGIWRAAGGTGGSTGAGATGRAAIVYVHGGAFVGGGLGNRPALFRSLADHGYPVIDVEYRLAPPPRWDQAAPDVRCALSWVAEHASDLGADPARIVVLGESAGGNLALLGAYGTPEDATSSCGSSWPKVAAVIAIAPTADLAGLWQDATLMGAGHRFPEAYIGGPPSEFPDRYAAASPLSLIRAGLPPTLLITGSLDHLVAVERVTDLADRLRSAGVDTTYVIVPFAEHGFDGFPNGYGAQIEESILPAFIEAHT
jgi:acetyl esterase